MKIVTVAYPNNDLKVTISPRMAQGYPVLVSAHVVPVCVTNKGIRRYLSGCLTASGLAV